jgi:hypothetical protein
MLGLSSWRGWHPALTRENAVNDGLMLHRQLRLQVVETGSAAK